MNSKGLTLLFTGESLSSITTHSTDSNGVRHTHIHHGGGLLFTQSAALGLQHQSEHHFAANTRHQWPFEFHVPFGSPATQHHAISEATATIRYDLKATAHKTGLFSSNLKAAMSIVVLPVFPSMPQDGAAGQSPVERAGSLKVADICCCTCFGYKELRAIMRAPKSSLCVGETLPVSIEILNGLGSADLTVNSLTLSLETHLHITVRGGPGSGRRTIPLWSKVEEVSVAPNPALANPANMRAGLGVQVSSVLRSEAMTPDVQSAGFSSRNVVVAVLHVRNSRKICRVELQLGAPYLNLMPPQMQMQMQMPPIGVPMQMQSPFPQQQPPMQQQMQMVPLQQQQQQPPQYQAMQGGPAGYPPPQPPLPQQQAPWLPSQYPVQQPMWQPPQATAPATQSMHQTKEESVAAGAGAPGGYNPPAWQQQQQQQPLQQPAYTPPPQQHQQPGAPAPAYDPAPAYAPPSYNPPQAYAPGGAPVPVSPSHAEGASPPATS